MLLLTKAIVVLTFKNEKFECQILCDYSEWRFSASNKKQLPMYLDVGKNSLKAVYDLG